MAARHDGDGRDRVARQSRNRPRSVRSCHPWMLRDDRRSPQPASRPPDRRRCHVSLVALPDAVVSTLAGIYDVMNGAALMGLGRRRRSAVPRRDRRRSSRARCGSPAACRSRCSARSTSIDAERHRDRAVGAAEARRLAEGPLPAARGLAAAHARARRACCARPARASSCSPRPGSSTARTRRCTSAMRARSPRATRRCTIHPERVLVISGPREELVSSGASTTWHDMVLYLIARYAGATMAQEVARLFALQWHQDGLTPYIVFEGKTDHGDGEIRSAQQWLATHFSVANPVEEMIKRSKLAERTFKRRFTAATGLAPHRLRAAPAHRRRQAPAGAHRRRRSTRSAGASATRTRRSSAACSSAPPAWRRARIASAFASRTSRGRKQWPLTMTGLDIAFYFGTQLADHPMTGLRRQTAAIVSVTATSGRKEQPRRII